MEGCGEDGRGREELCGHGDSHALGEHDGIGADLGIHDEWKRR